MTRVTKPQAGKTAAILPSGKLQAIREVKSVVILAGMPTRVIAGIAVLLMLPWSAASGQATSEAEVRAALASFIQAFDNLEWDKFRLAFDDNATVFYPRGFPERANGRAEFEQTFKKVFEQIRDGKKAPPYMDIQARDLKIQMVGEVAVATFHLDDRAGFLNRRTVVLKKTPAGWRIVHLHASEVSLAAQAAQSH